MINLNTIKYQNFSTNPVAFSGHIPEAEKMVKDINLARLYGASNLGKIEINGKIFDIKNTSSEYFSISDKIKQLGYIAMTNREYNGKSCYSVAEISNFSREKGLGTKLMQIGYKSHKDNGKTGEFRVHDVAIEAEEFYEKLGFIEDPKRAEQWYLPFENEHILEQYNGGL